MIWLSLLLLVFWKPVYYVVRYAVAYKQKDDIDKSYFWHELKTWFSLLWVLIRPAVMTKETTHAAQKPEQNPQSNA